MKNIFKLLKNFKNLFVFVIFLYPSKAYAYFDPGTGAFILQALITFFAAVVVYLGYPIRLVKQLYKKIFKKQDIESIEDKEVLKKMKNSEQLY
jgi:hypothetical protein